MFSFYFLDTYINTLKYLQRVALDISIINWYCLHQDARKNSITWIDHNVTRYHKFIAVPHVLP